MINLCKNHKKNFNQEAVIMDNGQILEFEELLNQFKSKPQYTMVCEKCKLEQSKKELASMVKQP